MSLAQGGEPLAELARALLSRPACARTLDPSRPGRLAETLLGQARASGALGAICHTVKFCDPYLARLPHLRALFRSADLPLLLLEGDCTLRSLGQQRTRVQAFLEMLR
jgi:benzoyl-CoA reductase/2-hydroxyglutaryl-CoA dehydratase subunit BcrC/BadD/HgdB